jgi:peptide/nickel transport system substrate-binding protein
MDPLSPSNTADGRSILFNVFEGLVKPDTEGNLQGAGAESWTVEEWGREYTFTLREGLLFSDGSPVGTGDVVFSLQTAMDAKFTGFDQIETVEALGERRIRLSLKNPDPEFLPYLTSGIVPASNPDREKNPIGTGPFVIASYTPQVSLVLEKNPHYREGDRPGLDRVTIVFAANSEALLTGLRGGNINGANVTGGVLEQLDGGRFDVFRTNSNAVQLLALNNGVRPLDDVRVRRAINYGIDIPEIIETAFYGRGESSGSPLIPGLRAAYDESLRDPYPADVEKARALLGEAGFSGGFPLEITVASNYSMHVDTAQVVVNQLARIGIRAAIKLVDWGTWLSEVYRGRNYQATIISLDSNTVSPRGFLARYRSDAGGNFINFKNSAYDRVFDASLAETGDAERRELYREAQRIISENAASVYIQDIQNFQVLAAGRFAGVVHYPLYVVDFKEIYSLK